MVKPLNSYFYSIFESLIMKKIIYLLLLSVLIFSCTDDNNNEDEKNKCTKDLVTYTSIFGLLHKNIIKIPCDSVVIKDTVIIAPPNPTPQNFTYLENFTYDIISSKFTANTGNNTSKFQLKVKLNNNNDFKVYGFPYFNLKINGKESFTPLKKGSCTSIDANSSCIYTYDEEESLEYRLNSIELISVKYILIKKE